MSTKDQSEGAQSAVKVKELLVEKSLSGIEAALEARRSQPGCKVRAHLATTTR